MTSATVSVACCLGVTVVISRSDTLQDGNTVLNDDKNTAPKITRFARPSKFVQYYVNEI